MDYNEDKVRRVVEVEDRLSRLPDELIHNILSHFDMQFVVQTCLLLSSKRWKLLWTSMPCLNFSTKHFKTLKEFDKFVNHVVCNRNHQVDVSCVKLGFSGRVDQDFVRKIAKYAYSHNVQQLTVHCNPKYQPQNKLHPCLFSSQSLKHFTLTTSYYDSITPKTPWDFPALTTLHLHRIRLCDEISVGLFSKCVNLKDLTLRYFLLEGVEVFDIITPRLSDLILTHGYSVKTINVIAPQLENLTIIDCKIQHLNAPPQLSSFCYKLTYFNPLDYCLLKFTNVDRFHSLNKVNLCFPCYFSESNKAYQEEDARKTINMLQYLHSATYITLNVDIIECLSSFPKLVSNHPSPFSNLISLSIESNEGRDDAYSWKMSRETRNFFFDNFPNATFIMELPTIETHIMELEAWMIKQQGNMDGERKQRAIEKTHSALDKLMAEMNVQVGKERHSLIESLKEEFYMCLKEIRDLVNQEKAIISKQESITSLLQYMHNKQERTEVEAHFSQQLQESQRLHDRLVSQVMVSDEIILAYEKILAGTICVFNNRIPTPSTSSIHPMPVICSLEESKSAD